MLIDMTKSLVKPTNIITYFEIAQWEKCHDNKTSVYIKSHKEGL